MTVNVISAVTQDATETLLLTIDEIKSELSIDPDDTSNDAWLERALGQVSRSISSYCNRQFHQEQIRDTILFETDAYPYQLPGGAAVLQLSRWPVIDLLDIAQTTGPSTTNPLAADTDYKLDKRSGQLYRLDAASRTPTRWESLPVVVNYTAGYLNIPDDLVIAATRWMVWRWNERGRDPTLKAVQQPDYGTKSYWVGGPPTSGGVPQEIASLVAPYRQPVIA